VNQVDGLKEINYTDLQISFRALGILDNILNY